MVVGVFAILGTFFGLEVDGLFVTAMLTIIGFSVHDTIVVYDRIRENRARHAGEPFTAIVNHSILQTLGRSINTSLTVVFTLTALLLFGGDVDPDLRPRAPHRDHVRDVLVDLQRRARCSTVWEEWDAAPQGARPPRAAGPSRLGVTPARRPAATGDRR